MERKNENIAFILAENGETISGIGFLATSNLIITCAHIVQHAGSGPGKTVTIKFQGSKTTIQAFVTAWRPPDDLDLAILRINKKPKSTSPLLLNRAIPNTIVEVISEYPKNINSEETIVFKETKVTAEIARLDTQRIYEQLDTIGVSGSPVYDPKKQIVVGMVMGKIDDENAYAMPVAALVRLYPSWLRLSSPLVDEDYPRELSARHPEEEEPLEHLAQQLISYKRYRNVANWLEEREIPIKKGEVRKSIVQSKPHRVLNLNFASTEDGHVLARNEFLLSEQEYDLLVDVGQLWDTIPSLVREHVPFPEDSENQYLSTTDREKGWFDVEVVFFSRDFYPNLVSSRMRISTRSLERSIPYVDGELAKSPGPVRLTVTPSKIPQKRKRKSAHGRVCLYYGTQILQSAAITVKVTRWPEWTKKPCNKAAIDYVLTPNLENIDASLSQRIRITKEGETATTTVKAGILINESFSGTHRIFLKLDEDGEGNEQLPPAWKAYDSTLIRRIISDASEIMENMSLDEPDFNSDTYLFDKFKYDLTELAKLGAKLYSTILQGITPDKNIPPLVWRKKFRSLIKPGDVIQLARAGSVPATHIIPWALVYDHPLEINRSDRSLRLCRVVEEQWNNVSAKRKKPFSERENLTCPYEHEHDDNVICPFGFWGYKYTLEQPISALLAKNWDLEPARQVIVETPVKMAVASTSSSEYSSLRRKHFRTIRNTINADFIPVSPAAERDQLRDSLRAPNLVYILGYGGKLDRVTYINIGRLTFDDNRYLITPDLPAAWGEASYIDVEKWVENRPLVFINGCYTSELTPEMILNFVSGFRDLMAGGVIGTEIPVTVEEGHLAAEKFFERLGRGEDVGQAILGMRWDLLNQGSFLGLAYTPYAMADLHLEHSNGQ